MAGHPTNCNYYYAMTEILGLDPGREEDLIEFQYLIDQGEIRRTKFGDKVSDSQFDTDSIVSYLQRERKRVEKELLGLTRAIEKLTDKIEENFKALMVKIEEMAKEKEKVDKPEWEKD
jgi:hypothetical protein